MISYKIFKFLLYLKFQIWEPLCFLPETTTVNFLNLMVPACKAFANHFLKWQFVVLLFLFRIWQYNHLYNFYVVSVINYLRLKDTPHPLYYTALFYSKKNVNLCLYDIIYIILCMLYILCINV